MIGQSDVDCLEEVIRRRLKHVPVETQNLASPTLNKKTTWPLPQIFLIDGGKPQVNRVIKILKEFKIDLPVVGIAKGPARKKNEFILVNCSRDVIRWVNSNQNLLIQVRDEAHRFAIAYQRKLRRIKK